jgi:hypothetical protein
VSVSSPCKYNLTHLDLKKLDEEDWTYFDNFLSTDECIKIVNSFEDNYINLHKNYILHQ